MRCEIRTHVHCPLGHWQEAPQLHVHPGAGVRVSEIQEASAEEGGHVITHFWEAVCTWFLMTVL